MAIRIGNIEHEHDKNTGRVFFRQDSDCGGDRTYYGYGYCEYPVFKNNGQACSERENETGKCYIIHEINICYDGRRNTDHVFIGSLEEVIAHLTVLTDDVRQKKIDFHEKQKDELACDDEDEC